MKKVQKPVFLGVILLVLIVGLLLGCDKSVVVKDLEVESDFYQKHGHFLGNNKVKFKVDLANFRKDNLAFYWQANGGRFLSQGNSEVTYLTPKLPGNYNLKLQIKEGKKTLTTFNFSFTVEGDYPEEVTLKEVTSTSFTSGVELNWLQYVADDFYGYKILRSSNFYIDDRAEVIASIEDKSKTSYIDHDISPGQVYTYQVMVTNDRGYVSASNEEQIKVLPREMKKIEVNDKLSKIKINSEINRGYIGNLEQRKLMILDIKKDKIIENLELAVAPEILKFSKDREYLFIAEAETSILLRVNLNTLEIKKYNLEAPIIDLTVGSDYLYALTSGSQNLLKFNLDQGTVEKLSLKEGNKAISGNRLQLIDSQHLLVDEVFGPALIYRVNNLSTSIGNFDLGTIEDIAVQKLENEQYLYVGSSKSQGIQALKRQFSGELKKVGEFDTSFPAVEFAIDKKKEILIAGYEAKEISIFSLANYSLLHKIKLNNYVFHLAFAPQQDKVYLLTADIDQTNCQIIVIDLKTEGGHYIWDEENS